MVACPARTAAMASQREQKGPRRGLQFPTTLNVTQATSSNRKTREPILLSCLELRTNPNSVITLQSASVVDMRTIRRLSSEVRKAVEEMPMATALTVAESPTLDDCGSTTDTSSVISDDPHDSMVQVHSCSVGPLSSQLSGDATYGDACEFCCHHCFSSDKGPSSKSNGNETYYTICQVRRHNTRESCWLVAGDTIYDATPYLKTHPGGMKSILRKGGGAVDVTRDLQFHSAVGQRMFQKYKIGKIQPCGGSGYDENKKAFWVFW